MKLKYEKEVVTGDYDIKINEDGTIKKFPITLSKNCSDGRTRYIGVEFISKDFPDPATPGYDEKNIQEPNHIDFDSVIKPGTRTKVTFTITIEEVKLSEKNYNARHHKQGEKDND